MDMVAGLFVKGVFDLSVFLGLCVFLLIAAAVAGVTFLEIREMTRKRAPA
jgi:hypothetical protein